MCIVPILDIIMRTGPGIRAPDPALTTSTLLGAKHVMATHDLTVVKLCRKCGELKPIVSFSLHEWGVGGRRARCKQCVKAADRERRLSLWDELQRGMIGPASRITDAQGRDWTWAFVVFANVPGFPGYKASSDGWVWSCWGSGFSSHLMTDRWRRLKPSHGKNGHRRITLTRDGKRFYRGLHATVLGAFIGPCPDGLECCHYNGDPSDNRLINLRWDTSKANAADRVRHGRQRNQWT